jgi:hypothetical protein
MNSELNFIKKTFNNSYYGLYGENPFQFVDFSKLYPNIVVSDLVPKDVAYLVTPNAYTNLVLKVKSKHDDLTDSIIYGMDFGSKEDSIVAGSIKNGVFTVNDSLGKFHIIKSSTPKFPNVFSKMWEELGLDYEKIVKQYAENAPHHFSKLKIEIPALNFVAEVDLKTGKIEVIFPNPFLGVYHFPKKYEGRFKKVWVTPEYEKLFK